MIGIQYEPKRLTEAYEEVDETTVFCPNGHSSRKIPVDFNLRWHTWYAIDEKDMLCPVCNERMVF